MPEDPNLFDLKKDIFSRTELSRGVISRDKDRATRFFRVTRKNGATLTRSTAIQFLYESIGDFHDEVADLPLQDIRAVSWSEHKVYLIARYGFTNTGWGNAQPNVPAFTVRSYTTYEPMPIYTHYGSRLANTNYPGAATGAQDNPLGILYENTLVSQFDLLNVKVTPRPTGTFQRPVIRYVISTRLSSNPHGVLWTNYIGRCNDNTVFWDGRSFPANTLRCDGARVDWVADQGGTVTYLVDYYFTAADLWVTQVPRIIFTNDDPPQPDYWEITWEPVYPLANFALPGFPVH